MSKNRFKRGRELVDMCNNRNNNEMMSTHSHFNEEPCDYETSENVTDREGLIEEESLELIQLSDLIGPCEGSSHSHTIYDRENVEEMVSETNCYGAILVEHADNDRSQRKTIQILDSTPDVQVEYIDYQIDENDNLNRAALEIQNNSEGNETCDEIQNISEGNEGYGMLLPETAETETLPVTVTEENESIQSEQVSSTEKKTSRKRKINKHEWKQEKNKNARAMGKEYVTKKGKVIAKKTICQGSLCTNVCRLDCSSHFSDEDRQRLLDDFYSLQIDAKNSILFKSMKPTPVKRRLVAAQRVRRQTFTYSVKKSDNNEIQICKKAFISLFQISTRKVQVIQDKHTSGQILPQKDKRGLHDNRPNKMNDHIKEYIMTHIKSFPSEESHYSRHENPNKLYLSPLLNIREMYRLYIQKCETESKESIYHVKECAYRKVFCTQFNLSFGVPRSDVCSKCENEDHDEDLEEHRVTYKQAYELMKTDRNQCISEEGKLYCTVDIQQTMPLPKMPVGDAFYLRQIWFYNLGIHLASKNKNNSVMCTWTEEVAKKGSFEVACALHYLAMYLKSTCGNNPIKHLIVWSDSCSGQNKNFNLICQYQFMILKKYFDIIDHKFPVVGHTYMDSDRDFGRIEKALRKHEKIYTPEEYRCIIKNNTTKNSQVVDMKEHLYDIEDVQKQLKLINRTKNTLGHKVEFRDEVKWIRVEQFGSFLYKKSYDPNTPFLMVDVAKKGTKICPEAVQIQRLARLRGQVSDEKKNDIRKQLKFIPMEKRFFFEEILNS